MFHVKLGGGRIITLYEVFKRRGMTDAQAREMLEEMRERVWEGEDPEEVLAEEGLEPDYVFDLCM